jgi:maltose alpha-D-glucosyltransferase / alpha-amylase
VAIEDLWYKNAVIYCLDVEKYMDASGDGIGDFEGLSRRLDYLAGLGVTCIWLQPFYPSPNRDNGYDVADYYGVHPKHGSLGDYVEFMNHARANGMHVIVDLVVNHTSIEHPWFQSARSDPASLFRDWYVWSRQRPENHHKGTVFPGFQQTTWTRDEDTGEYYFHRFYDFQPDLNTHNPAVRAEIYKIMGFWLELGVSGFRLDAVPFLIERKGPDIEPAKDYGLLKEMRDFLQWRRGDAILLGEANVPPEETLDYLGKNGERLQMMLNFAVNQRLFYALATGDVRPLSWALKQTLRNIPKNAQWVQFLRTHDELDLGRLTRAQRKRVFEAFAPNEDMRLYGRGIRRRLAPMLGNNRRRLELAFSLLYSLPGTPMLQYGDEIGIGEDLSLPEREAGRTPMQWTGERHAGFSRAERTVRPVVDDETFSYRRVNVAAQQRDPESLLNWTGRMLHARRQCPEISWGDCTVLLTDTEHVLVLRYDFRGTSLITLHNFSSERQIVEFSIDAPNASLLVDIFGSQHSRATADSTHHIRLKPYGYRWLRVGAADNALARAPF